MVNSVSNKTFKLRNTKNYKLFKIKVKIPIFINKFLKMGKIFIGEKKSLEN